jgi:hypothetical protein
MEIAETVVKATVFSTSMQTGMLVVGCVLLGIIAVFMPWVALTAPLSRRESELIGFVLLVLGSFTLFAYSAFVYDGYGVWTTPVLGTETALWFFLVTAAIYAFYAFSWARKAGGITKGGSHPYSNYRHEIPLSAYVVGFMTLLSIGALGLSLYTDENSNQLQYSLGIGAGVLWIVTCIIAGAWPSRRYGELYKQTGYYRFYVRMWEVLAFILLMISVELAWVLSPGVANIITANSTYIWLLVDVAVIIFIQIVDYGYFDYASREVSATAYYDWSGAASRPSGAGFVPGNVFNEPPANYAPLGGGNPTYRSQRQVTH